MIVSVRVVVLWGTQQAAVRIRGVVLRKPALQAIEKPAAERIIF
ncbi:hypothetical protein [Dyadobacter fermentans]|nr:hypothetical protein [Dyadobacter fermentans]